MLKTNFSVHELGQNKYIHILIENIVWTNQNIGKSTKNYIQNGKVQLINYEQDIYKSFANNYS